MGDRAACSRPTSKEQMNGYWEFENTFLDQVYLMCAGFTYSTQQGEVGSEHSTLCVINATKNILLSYTGQLQKSSDMNNTFIKDIVKDKTVDNFLLKDIRQLAESKSP